MKAVRYHLSPTFSSASSGVKAERSWHQRLLATTVNTNRGGTRPAPTLTLTLYTNERSAFAAVLRKSRQIGQTRRLRTYRGPGVANNPFWHQTINHRLWFQLLGMQSQHALDRESLFVVRCTTMISIEVQ
jgi:hypothetical protein